jgi:hypothetical protein
LGNSEPALERAFVLDDVPHRTLWRATLTLSRTASPTCAPSRDDSPRDGATRTVGANDAGDPARRGVTVRAGAVADAR